MKIAFVHDWLTSFGGAERVLLKLHENFPEAPIYTLVYNKKNMEKYFSNIKVITSFMQKIPGSKKHYREMLPLMPMAIEQFNLKDYDLIISSSSACAKGINVSSKTIHICYCHTPMRYAWDMYNEYNDSKNKIKKFIIAKSMSKLRIWDYVSANRVDYFIANSENVRKRIEKHYRREAYVIYPPIKNEFYGACKNEEIQDYYLLVTRLVKYKSTELIIKAFNENGKKLVIIGTGPDEKKLKRIAKNNIKFLKNVSDEELKNYYKKCKAFVFMAEEDFGMVMAEVQASGRPVIAYEKGGAKEIVIDGKTGILVKEKNIEKLNEAVEKMEKEYLNYSSEEIIKNAKRFSEDEFKTKINEFIERVIEEAK